MTPPKGPVWVEPDWAVAAREFTGRPALILPDALADLSRYAGSRYAQGGRELPYRRTEDGTALLAVMGPLSNRGWGYSYELLQYQLAAALADPQCSGILLDIDSPGGQAAGAFETAALVREVAKTKPVVAVVNSMAASAAYAIASGASRIVTTPSGISGSIGVVMLHADYSKLLQKAGVTPTLIFAGAHKVDGNPYEPLSDAVKAELQGEVDALYGQFVDTVALGRPGMSKAAIRATEARVFIGADAVKAGLADELGDFDFALDRMASGTITGARGAGMASDRPASEAAAAAEWACAAARDLAIDGREAWDGDAARDRMLDAAGFGGASFDPAKARRGFLAYDRHNAGLKGSYKLPFADLIDGELKAISGGLRAAASRLPGTDIPDAVRAEARAVIDGYEKRIRDAEGNDNDDDDKSASSGEHAMTITQADLDKAVAEAVAKATADAKTEGAKTEAGRVAAILGLDEAKGREEFARMYAFETALSVDEVKAKLAAKPKTGVSDLEARAGAFNPGGAVGGGATPDKQAAIDASWSAVAADLNKQRAHIPGFRTRT